MLDSTVAAYIWFSHLDLLGKCWGERKGSTTSNSSAVRSTVGTVMWYQQHTQPLLLWGSTRLGLPSSFSLPVSQQHWHILSGALCSCERDGAGGSAVAPRQRAAELAREWLRREVASLLPQVPGEKACHFASYCKDWLDSFSLLLNGRSQESSLWRSSHLGQRRQGPAAVASFWSWLLCEVVSAWAWYGLSSWLCASTKQYVFFSFLRVNLAMPLYCKAFVLHWAL